MPPAFHTKIVAGYVDMFIRFCGSKKVRIYKPGITRLIDGHLYLEVKNNAVENIYLGIERLGNESSKIQHIEQAPVFQFDPRLHRYRVSIPGINNCSRYMMGCVTFFPDTVRQEEIREYTTALLNDADKPYVDLSFRQYWRELAEAAVRSSEGYK